MKVMGETPSSGQVYAVIERQYGRNNGNRGLAKARKVVLIVVKKIILHGTKGVQLEVNGVISVGRLAILK